MKAGGIAASAQTTWTTCLVIKRTDGVVLGLTELDQDISAGGVNCQSASGIARFNLQEQQNLEKTSIQLDGMVDGIIFTRNDLIARRYDYAAVQVFRIDWAGSDPDMILFTGRFGPVTIKEFGWSVEMRPLSHQTTFVGGELSSNLCRVDLGSPRCGFNVSSTQQSGTVTSTDGFKTLTVSGISGINQDGGLLTWTSGLNAGLSNEVNAVVGGTLTLTLDSFAQINPGDTFSIQQGCDKTFFTCVNVFNNGVNFQGEPHVPGLDHLLNYPDYKSPHK